MQQLPRRLLKPAEATIYTETGSPALVIQGIRREGDKLVVEGKALGSMYMDMVLSARDFLRLLRVMCSWGLLSFLLLLPLYCLRSVWRRLTGKRARGQGVSRV